MRSLLFAPAVCRALFAVSVMTALVSQGFPVQPQGASPPITLDAGNGRTAELTNYALTNYGQTPSGGFRGDFCFTLRNGSFTSPPQLPIYLTSVGLLSRQQRPIFARTASQPEQFVESVPLIDGLREIPVILLVARNAHGTYGTFTNLLDGPTDGVAAGSSADFCFTISSPQPFSLVDLLDRLVVIFSNEVAACYTTVSLGPNGLPQQASIHIDSFSATEIGLRVTNFDYDSGLRRRVTGAAFDVPEGGTGYTLATSPTPILNGLTFSADPDKLFRGVENPVSDYDFGLIKGGKGAKAGPADGLDIGDASIFTVYGDFEGLTTASILQLGVVRFNRELASMTQQPCGGTIPTGDGIRGSVATVPR